MFDPQPYSDGNPRPFQTAVGIFQRLKLEVFQTKVGAFEHQRTKIDAGTGIGFAVTNRETVGHGSIHVAVVISPATGEKVDVDGSGKKQRDAIAGIAIRQVIAERIAVQMLHRCQHCISNAPARQRKLWA